ncbi:hypothetical protein [Chlamydia muridarum]|uniref:Uncharacterized protein n=1 Tax=Chlamydia muridarum (strain MoPn / Nigg) TaxID=243161 RepID=Q9PKJ8_CHLMU|nr:hypothetical protein [Chlamydia muridarum]AAF39316.1 hypothetical protein TC_0467 [Chlamydia muridarum str. Nigg]KDU80202.1 hypothetical protein DU17_0514 [Chlamydia muridarum]KDU81474.1 hypothetical protein DU18_0514 [Chlamydia muridarum]KDU82046.1 hypothetical protein DU19_0512 [Chlamydia muridarum]KDU83426.1 hypothetical protein DU20_0512 [Chlamydia muridarum]
MDKAHTVHFPPQLQLYDEDFTVDLQAKSLGLLKTVAVYAKLAASQPSQGSPI